MKILFFFLLIRLPPRVFRKANKMNGIAGAVCRQSAIEISEACRQMSSIVPDLEWLKDWSISLEQFIRKRIRPSQPIRDHDVNESSTNSGPCRHACFIGRAAA